MKNENGKLNGNNNGKWIWILMDEQMDFIMEMKMGKLIGIEWEINLENDLIITND